LYRMYKRIGRPCPVCGRELNLAEFKTVEQMLDFFEKEDAYGLRLVERMVEDEQKSREISSEQTD